MKFFVILYKLINCFELLKTNYLLILISHFYYHLSSYLLSFTIIDIYNNNLFFVFVKILKTHIRLQFALFYLGKYRIIL